MASLSVVRAAVSEVDDAIVVKIQCMAARRSPLPAGRVVAWVGPFSFAWVNVACASAAAKQALQLAGFPMHVWFAVHPGVFYVYLLQRSKLCNSSVSPCLSRLPFIRACFPCICFSEAGVAARCFLRSCLFCEFYRGSFPCVCLSELVEKAADGKKRPKHEFCRMEKVATIFYK